MELTDRPARWPRKPCAHLPQAPWTPAPLARCSPLSAWGFIQPFVHLGVPVGFNYGNVGPSFGPTQRSAQHRRLTWCTSGPQHPASWEGAASLPAPLPALRLNEACVWLLFLKGFIILLLNNRYSVSVKTEKGANPSAPCMTSVILENHHSRQVTSSNPQPEEWLVVK